MTYTVQEFGRTVRNDFNNRQTRNLVMEHGLIRASAASALETKALGHPDFERLAVGERQTVPMVALFLDLTNFTGRTFWDNQEETVDLAHAVLTGFIEIVSRFGGHPLGLRGDGLFAGFSPGDPAFTATMALNACAFALNGVESEVNTWLKQRGSEPVQARAGLDFGNITFVRTGSSESSEVNPLGFAANFAAKCEKYAASWEVVVGEGIRNLLPGHLDLFTDCVQTAKHPASPKQYTRGAERKTYHFYDYRWRRSLPHLPGVMEALNGLTTSDIRTR